MTNNSMHEQLAKLGAVLLDANMQGQIWSWEAINEKAIELNLVIDAHDIEDATYADGIEATITELLK